MTSFIGNLMAAIGFPSTRRGYSRLSQTADLPPKPDLPPLLRLPPHLLGKILWLLPLPSRACLVLTCQELYQTYKPIIEDRRLQFPCLLRNLNPTISLDQATVPRNIFLHQLQNEKWAFCNACLKLHPWTQLKDDNTCHSRAGIVGLCPCISLTHRDKTRLFRTFFSKTNVFTPPKQDPRFELLWEGNPRFPPELVGKCRCVQVHHCRVIFYPDVRIDIKVQVYYGAEHQQWILLAQTDFKVALHSWPRPASIEPYFACPHQSLLSWAFHPSQKDTDCVVCGSRFRLRRTPQADAGERDLFVYRKLGGVKWPPDVAWQDQCRLRDPISYRRLWVSETIG